MVAEFEPTGDQPAAIERLSGALAGGARYACLLGATGTGKTFTMAHVIERLGMPTLIISHNKTLAAQLFEELREFFPHNSVNYFVSYYDYYQPEAYIPARDIYIEKDSSRNEELDQLRLAATSNILSRRDTIVVASVSCIFGLGSPAAYRERVLTLTEGEPADRRGLLLGLNDMQYTRAEVEFRRGTYRVRGDALEVWPAYEKFGVRVEIGDDRLERIELFHPASGEVLARERQFLLFPAVHYVMPDTGLGTITARIRADLEERVTELRHGGRLLARTRYDLELIEEVGYCPGVENYSRYFDGRAPGERPYCLLDYFEHAPRGGEGAGRGSGPGCGDWLCIIDESHVTIPQIRAMYHGDRRRKEVLVEHGFRLPAALDNRPLRFEEFEALVPRMLFVSATPGSYELEKAGGAVAEQIIRPTGLVDPRIEVRPTSGQVPDMVREVRVRAARSERVLVTALTKRLCEDLASYLSEQGLRVRYLHSEIDTLDRVRILSDLRTGEFDVLVGVNLLREGLDLPEVSLVCILDADKEGFLRSPTSLIQQMGRAARNVNAEVIMYADRVTPAMRAAMEETERRRRLQLAYNEARGITPRSVRKAIRRGLDLELRARRRAREAVGSKEEEFEAAELMRTLEGEMLEAAERLEFERAAVLRDQVLKLRKMVEESGRLGLPAGKVTRGQIEGRKASGGSTAGMPGTRATRRSRRPRR